MLPQAAVGELPTETVAYPVMIHLEGDKGQGSGFFLLHEDSVFLVTARHVLLDDRGEFWSNSLSLFGFGMEGNAATSSRLAVDLKALDAMGELHVHEDWDAAILRVATAGGIEQQRPVVYLPPVTVQEGGRLTVVNWKNLTRLEGLQFAARVYVGGFPNSVGLPDGSQLDQRFPLLREGIIAGIHPGNSNIILDCRVDGGNSGGPVIWRTEDQNGDPLFSVMGLVSQYVPVAEQWVDSRTQSTNLDIANSGYSVVTPMDAVIELLEKQARDRRAVVGHISRSKD
ncbi:MAG: trypsin-like peptidase domain-containing protein [Verrucomicrobiota bacterium]